MPHFTYAEISTTGVSPWKSLDARGIWKAALESLPNDTGTIRLYKRRDGSTRPYAIELTGAPHSLTPSTPEVVFYSTGQEEIQAVWAISGTLGADVDIQLVDRS